MVSDAAAVPDVVHPVHITSVVGVRVSDVLRPFFGGAPVIHLGQRLRVRDALRPDVELEVEAHVDRVAAKSQGFLVEISTTVRADARPVLDAGTLLLASVVEGGGFENRPETWNQLSPAVAQWLDQGCYTMTAADIAAFGACTGDDQAIHLSDEFARAFGLPGVIAHGMHTFAACYEAAGALAASGNGRLRSVSMRFTRPVLPCQQVTTQVSRCGSVVAVRAVSQGRPVTRGGFALLESSA